MGSVEVPLVMYKDGIRHILGTATVAEDGTIEAMVTKDAMPNVRDLFQPSVGEFSIAPVRRYTIVNDPPI